MIKSLYGLKQASRCWNNLINDYLVESGPQRLEADPCIYVREIKVVVNGQTVIKFQIVALYVDDLIIAASNKNLITDLERVFEARFMMKKLNKIKQILGMGVHHDKDRNIIYITQQQSMESVSSVLQWVIDYSSLSNRCPRKGHLKLYTWQRFHTVN